MDKFFSFFGKFVLVAAILGGIAYGAYSLGRTTAPASQSGAASTTAAPTANPTTDPGLMPEAQPETTKGTIITAGVGAESGLSFTKYQMTVPQSWTPNHTTTNEGTWVDTLTLTKGTNQLKIFQAATGGAMCLYAGDADFEGPSSTYDSFVTITTADNIVLRRGTTNTNNGATKGYTMCQKGSESYGQPTVFGHMSLTTALNPDPALLAEVDAMIASLKKLQ
ncbi:hypothetical protein KJZ67_00775 [Patescibacteria group bacterium]|nr:hypothetical protein [Patescibacteria group bacterium]